MTETAFEFSRPSWWRTLLSGSDLWTAALVELAGRLESGGLVITLPDGRSRFVGSKTGPQADITLHDDTAARRLFLGGPIGFAEAYIDEQWSSRDLTALLELAARNVDRVMGNAGGSGPWRWLHRLAHRLRANTKAGSRRNIAFHYDLGNDFYRLWLDPGMTYSSALYASPTTTLEEAQTAKLDRVVSLLAPKPGARVLEIGCGWGGLAERLAFEGVAVTGVTLSREQLAFARRRLGPRADLRLQDYRDTEGQYDGVVSIEMIEAVGEAQWPRYFDILRERLVPGGRAVIQAITIADRLFEGYRRDADFIQRHVFPGGMLPSPSILRDQAARAGLELAGEETFGESYALTCAEWRRRFHAAWPRIEALGFDARFRRLWDYYLAYCEAGFRAGTIDVGLYTLRRP